jgi:hypothetical protein
MSPEISIAIGDPSRSQGPREISLIEAFSLTISILNSRKEEEIQDKIVG